MLNALEHPSELTRLDAFAAAGFDNTPRLLFWNEYDSPLDAGDYLIVLPEHDVKSAACQTSTVKLESWSGSMLIKETRRPGHWIYVRPSTTDSENRIHWREMMSEQGDSTIVLDVRHLSSAVDLRSLLENAFSQGVRRWQLVLLGRDEAQREHVIDDKWRPLSWICRRIE